MSLSAVVGGAIKNVSGVGVSGGKYVRFSAVAKESVGGARGRGAQVAVMEKSGRDNRRL